MPDSMRVMSEKPLNEETPNRHLKSWITANKKFFKRNQGDIPEAPVDVAGWRLTIEGEVRTPLVVDFETLLRLPKAIAANTLECSGNGRSLLEKKASGNPWTIGGVGHAVWGGVWLRTLLDKAALKPDARHVAFEGFDTPLGKAQIKFVRSIPIEKAMASTLLADEMNGDPLPLQPGFPLRALALGWTGANCVKWLRKIIVLKDPFDGFYMNKVYRVFDKGQDPEDGAIVTGIGLKSIIIQPETDEVLPMGDITILGAAYAGETMVEKVELSADSGDTWHPASFIGPCEPYAWRHWQYIWKAPEPGKYTILSRATDVNGKQQPLHANWNKLGYGNNGITEHGFSFMVQ